MKDREKKEIKAILDLQKAEHTIVAGDTVIRVEPKAWGSDLPAIELKAWAFASEPVHPRDRSHSQLTNITWELIESGHGIFFWP